MPRSLRRSSSREKGEPPNRYSPMNGASGTGRPSPPSSSTPNSPRATDSRPPCQRPSRTRIPCWPVPRALSCASRTARSTATSTSPTGPSTGRSEQAPSTESPQPRPRSTGSCGTPPWPMRARCWSAAPSRSYLAAGTPAVRPMQVVIAASSSARSSASSPIRAEIRR